MVKDINWIRDYFTRDFLDTVSHALKQPYEICGNLVLDHEAKMTSYDIRKGETEEETRRKKCANRIDTSTTFHTHPRDGPFPPSYEDLWKVIKDGPVEVSYIFTQYGLFILYRVHDIDYPRPTKDQLREVSDVVTPLMRELCRSLGRGCAYTPDKRNLVDEFIEILEYNFPVKIEFIYVPPK